MISVTDIDIWRGHSQWRLVDDENIKEEGEDEHLDYEPIIVHIRHKSSQTLSVFIVY